MTRDVDQVGTIGNDFDPLRHQAIDHARDRLFIAGDWTRRENHAIAARQRKVWVLLFGNARQCRPRLALAAGAKRNDLFGRQITVAFDTAKIRYAVETTG